MVYPIGIEAVTQRIQAIRERLDGFDLNTPNPLESTPETELFGQILNAQLKPADTPSQASDRSALEALVEDQAQKIGLDPSLVKAVVKTESAFNPKAISSAGAQGLMQLMPATAQDLGVRHTLDPHENVEGGTRYLKSLLNKYHSVPMALAAYNAGPGAVDKYGGIPPYSETQNYVNRVLSYQHQYAKQNAE